MTVDPAETPTIVTVAEGFYVRQAVDNIAWIDMDGFGLVVDALEQPELEAEVFAAIRSTLGELPIRYVLSTHTHYDHIALNDAFRCSFGAEIIDQQNNPSPSQGRWFEGSRRRALWLPTPGCHTPEDCCLWFPDDRVLFVGDIFGWGIIPLTEKLCDETAKLLRDTYTRLIEFDATTVIPGHGPICTTAELRRWIEYFEWLCEQVICRCGQGQSDEQIMREVTPPKDMAEWWRFLLWKHQDSLTKVLGAVRDGWAVG